MQISISARHGDLSPKSQERIEEKVQKLSRFFDRLTAVQVTADLENRDALSVEVRASAEHTEDFIATDQSNELMSALDSALHKVERQLRKHKEKLTGHRQTGIKRIENQIEPQADAE